MRERYSMGHQRGAGTIFGLLMVTLLTLAVLAIGVATAYTSSSTSCVNCHEMTTRYVSWMRSSHDDVECMDCHAGAGLLDYAWARLIAVPKTVRHYFGTVGTIKAHVKDGACLKCHFFSKARFYVYDRQLLNDSLFVPDDLHRAHFDDQEAVCTACHQGMVHGSVATGGVPMKRQVCDDCHRTRDVSARIRLPSSVR